MDLLDNVKLLEEFGKGKKMSGHMGNVQKTVQNLKIVELDVENNVVYVKGAVPGFNGSEIKKLNHLIKN